MASQLATPSLSWPHLWAKSLLRRRALVLGKGHHHSSGLESPIGKNHRIQPDSILIDSARGKKKAE